jgi:CheY-like chemotaxis protein
MKVLLVDDEAGKRERVGAFVTEVMPTVELTTARSFQSAIQELQATWFDAAILDMRLTTYDVSTMESGGRPRNLGGEEIMRKMTRRKLITPVILLTQYTFFRGPGCVYSFNDIALRLRNQYPTLFWAMIHFSHSNESWKENLQSALLQLEEGK